MRSNRPELVKQMTDVLDEIIPAIPVDDRTSALSRALENVFSERLQKSRRAMRLYWRPRQPKWARSRKREQARLLPSRGWSGQGCYKSVTTITRGPIFKRTGWMHRLGV
jgi:hypothetical protein